MTVDVKLRDGRIDQFGQDVKACALGQASSSIMARNIIGATARELKALKKLLTEAQTDLDDAPADTSAAISSLNTTLDVLELQLASAQDARDEAASGSYAARNAGLREAAGDILLFTDSDCRPADDWCAEMVAGMP